MDDPGRHDENAGGGKADLRAVSLRNTPTRFDQNDVQEVAMGMSTYAPIGRATPVLQTLQVYEARCRATGRLPVKKKS